MPDTPSHDAPPFSLELSLAPDDVALLLRQPELRGSLPRRRAMNSKAARFSLIWHDTPQGDLAAAGLSLAQRHTASGMRWRLEQMVPDTEAASPPGAPCALLSEHEQADPAWPAPLLPVAAFDGQHHSLTPPEAAISVTLLQGALRAVAAQRAICRVLLNGEGSAALAMQWAGRMRLEAPATSLAAEAFALSGRNPAMRRLGAPSLRPNQTVDDGFAFIVAHLAGVILHYAPAARLGLVPEPVHQMRVALRRLRSAILLFRRAVSCPDLDDATLRLKEMGRFLGPPRDWDVFTSGAGRDVGRAFDGDKPVAALLDAAERRRLKGYADLAAYLESPAWRQLGIALAHLVEVRPWRHFIPEAPDQAVRHAELQRAALADFASRALQRRLDAVTEPGPDLSGLSIEQLHDIRLHSKRLRYATEFFAPMFPGGTTRRFLRRMMALQEHLGHLNDGAVAATLMAELPGRSTAHHYAVGVVRGFVAANAAGSRRKIERTWQRFLRQNSFWN